MTGHDAGITGHVRPEYPKTTFLSEFVSAARQSPRLFFAPLVGAVNGVREELRRIAEGNAKGQDVGKSMKVSRRHRS